MTEKTRVLVVDDDPAIRKLLERVAVRAGFTVETARDGVEALELLEVNQYEIAIVDLMMPRLSGYELVQKISEIDPRPVVLVATAMANADVATLDDSMVRRVIRKPFDIKAISDVLIETERQIEERRALANEGVKVAPEGAVLPVLVPRSSAPEPEPRITADSDDENAAPKRVS
ncbi:MAG: response regulator [Thermoanaerobaculia bacterium]|nr:response regulator [Thermoanaerobaculia bacterium]